MDQFIQTLYADYGKKLDAIRAYLEKLGNRTDTVKSSSLDCVGSLIAKYNAVAEFNKTKPATAPSTQFATSDDFDTYEGDSSVDTVKLDAAIASTAKSINYEFEQATAELQGLVQLYQDLQDILNKIWDAWADKIQTVEKEL